MRTPSKRVPGNRRRQSGGADPADEKEWTVSGGAMKPLDLVEILGRGLAAGSAVSGSARVMSADLSGEAPGREIALSDGSQIVFTSVGGGKIPA